MAVLSLLDFIFHIQFILLLFKVLYSFLSSPQFPEVQDQRLHKWGCFLISLSSVHVVFIFWDLQRVSGEVTVVHIASPISFWGLCLLVKDGNFLVFPTGKLSVHRESSNGVRHFFLKGYSLFFTFILLSFPLHFLCPQTNWCHEVTALFLLQSSETGVTTTLMFISIPQFTILLQTQLYFMQLLVFCLVFFWCLVLATLFKKK